MAESKRKSLWNLIRAKSTAIRNFKDVTKEAGHRRTASDGDAVLPRRRSDLPTEFTSDRRRPRRPGANGKGKGRDYEIHRHDPGPLTDWPPSGMSSEEELSLAQAMQLISRGAPAFRGHRRPIPHAPDHCYTLYATVAGNHGDDTDAANLHDAMTQLMTLRKEGSGYANYPWETFEQPSYAFCFGKRAGTITLNHWVSLASVIPPSIPLRDSGVAPREITLDRIFERLQELERGLEDDDEDLMYKNLYRRLLRDPDKYLSPHKTLDKQITDLIMVLSRPDWIDFTLPKNQVATKFIYDNSLANAPTYHKFFHQLLLSVELDLRINSGLHLAEAKEKLVAQIPPSIQWNLALARRWRENIRVDRIGEQPDQIRLRFKLQKRQVRMLKRFIQMMKWPNLSETIACLKQHEAQGTLTGHISSHAMAFFSGLILPGTTFPFLIMNSLVDIDPDRATDDLALLTHIHPHCGFQYRGSYTYWTAASIVGKVLAPTCLSIGGWVGPARPTVHLDRAQIARIRQRKPPARSQTVTPDDVKTMNDRSDPLGPPAEVYPVKEYELVAPKMDEDEDYDYDGYLTDLVRIEMLHLRPSNANDSKHSITSGATSSDNGPKWFDASIHFAIDGNSWPLRLTFDVNFVHAWPCSDGPHPLFFDYVYESVRADKLVHVRDWNGVYGGINSSLDGSGMIHGGPKSFGLGSNGLGGGSKKGSNIMSAGGRTTTATDHTGQDPDNERVLVVEAFGVPDNEVLARAWCAHWGLSAVVADISKTCMACAIREAYAAALTVVILVDDEQKVENKDE
ncbi:hypothetical protein GE21DRAFT_1218228 [Neurospora crassa]|nr:hypothetical protein GE21DRAFT_1218228 [Neurospora crassa]